MATPERACKLAAGAYGRTAARNGLPADWREAVVIALTEELGRPGDATWRVIVDPLTPTVLTIEYRGRRIAEVGSSVAGRVVDRLLTSTAGRG